VRISLRRPPGSCQNRKPPAKLTIFFRGFRAGFSTWTAEVQGAECFEQVVSLGMIRRAIHTLDKAWRSPMTP
jgi:hypothetical protein